LRSADEDLAVDGAEVDIVNIQTSGGDAERFVEARDRGLWRLIGQNGGCHGQERGS
jgi:hypothetical protein